MSAVQCTVLCHYRLREGEFIQEAAEQFNGYLNVSSFYRKNCLETENCLKVWGFEMLPVIQSRRTKHPGSLKHDKISFRSRLKETETGTEATLRKKKLKVR